MFLVYFQYWFSKIKPAPCPLYTSSESVQSDLWSLSLGVCSFTSSQNIRLTSVITLPWCNNLEALWWWSLMYSLEICTNTHSTWIFNIYLSHRQPDNNLIFLFGTTIQRVCQIALCGCTKHKNRISWALWSLLFGIYSQIYPKQLSSLPGGQVAQTLDHQALTKSSHCRYFSNIS